MLSSRIFYLELNNERSRWRKRKNGLPQGSVLSPVYFNIYTNDQHVYPGTRRFIYADDFCVTAQYPFFTDSSCRIPSAEQRGKKIVKSQMGKYRTREHEPAEIRRCHSGPQTELQTAYTQHKDEGGHTQQSSVEIGKLEVGHKYKHD